ncbi:hypothetical protein EV127DRAFT_46266 [Xylaria flabelliformis]|nr:hypothetical protein EV127DRAFT_46266 [Xylaria flabelliformis]
MSLLDLLLVWNWQKMPDDQDASRDFASFLDSQTITCANTGSNKQSDQASRLADIGLILRDAEKHEEGVQRLEKALEICKKSHKTSSDTNEVLVKLGSIYRSQSGHERRKANETETRPYERNLRQGHIERANKLEAMGDIVERQGHFVSVTEETMAFAARQYDQEVVSLLLDKRQDRPPICNEMVAAAGENTLLGTKFFMFLLEGREDQLTIPEAVVKSIARRTKNSVDYFKLLFDWAGDQLPITAVVVEEVVRAGVASCSSSVLELLFERRGDLLPISEKAVELALKGDDVSHSTVVLEAILIRRGDKLPFPNPNEVVRLVSSGHLKKTWIYLKVLHQYQGNKLGITEEMVSNAWSFYYERHGG